MRERLVVMQWAPPWEPDEDEQLLAVVRAGHPPGRAPQVAGLARTPQACGTRLGILRRAGLDVPARPRAGGWTAKEIRRLIALYRDDVTLEQIGVELGRALGAVDDELARQRRAGVDLPPRKPRWTQEERRRLADLKLAGVSLSGLEREFGLTRGSINHQVRMARREGLLPPRDQSAT